MKCERCGEDKDILQGRAGKFLCDKCFLTTDPPKMVIVKLLSVAYEDGTRLYNQTLRCYENTMTIKMFQTCGWFLRCVRERKSLITYELEYHGEKQCIRCEATRFPKSFPKCLNANLCRFTAKKALVARPEVYLG